MQTAGGGMRGLKDPCRMTHGRTRNCFLEGIRQGRPIPIIGHWPVPDNHPLPYMEVTGVPEDLPETADIADSIDAQEHRAEGLSDEELPPGNEGLLPEEEIGDTRPQNRPQTDTTQCSVETHPEQEGRPTRTTLDEEEISFQGESEPDEWSVVVEPPTSPPHAAHSQGTSDPTDPPQNASNSIGN